LDKVCNDQTAEQMREMKTLSYSKLSEWIAKRKIENLVISGSSGTEYLIEIAAMWDGKPHGNITVVGGIGMAD